MFEVEFLANENGRELGREFIKEQPVEIRHQLGYALLNLQNLGRDLKGPQSKYLDDHIYELREKNGKVHYRLYYFFDGNLILVTHGSKTDHKKDQEEIEYAKRVRRTYLEMKRTE